MSNIQDHSSDHKDATIRELQDSGRIASTLMSTAAETLRAQARKISDLDEALNTATAIIESQQDLIKEQGGVILELQRLLDAKK